jgi:hypothetical protein
MRHTAGWAALITAAIVGIGLSGWLLSPRTTSGSLALDVIDQNGPTAKSRPGYTGQLIFAATSAQALDTEVRQSAAIWRCDRGAQAGHCLRALSVSRPSLLVALPLWPTADCNLPILKGAELSDRQVIITVDRGQGGACAAVGASPVPLSVLATHLENLPHGQITVKVRYIYGADHNRLVEEDSTTATL